MGNSLMSISKYGYETLPSQRLFCLKRSRTPGPSFPCRQVVSPCEYAFASSGPFASRADNEKVIALKQAMAIATMQCVRTRASSPKQLSLVAYLRDIVADTQ